MKGEHYDKKVTALLALLLALTACGGSGSYTMDGDELVLDNGMRLLPARIPMRN